MFQDLDSTIKNILDDPAAPTEVRNADVSFETPDKNFAPAQKTVGLFLYEVKENRELRDPLPIVERLDGIFVRRRPPLRVDCSYLMTTWSPATGPTKVAEEHQLLSEAFSWLSRFPTIPATYFVGSLVGQPFPPPTLVAQMDGSKSAGEFWTAMGVPPKPSFNLVVTIAMDLKQEVEGPMVTTTITGYRQDPNAGTEEEWINVGGVILNPAGNAVGDALVRLEPTGQIEVTDKDGRFVFVRVRRGTSYRLRARAVGLGEITRDIEIPSTSGEYNMQFL